jgi:hypothetical protein
MRRSPLVLLALLVAPPLAAQASTSAAPDPEILATVTRLFDAMRTKDTAALRAVFDSGARLVTAFTRRDGVAGVRATAIDGFLQSVAGATVSLDERIRDAEVRQDGGLATVWTPYAFYADGRFSHCGVDAFQLARTAAGWRIVALADTQRREGCTP